MPTKLIQKLVYLLLVCDIWPLAVWDHISPAGPRSSIICNIRQVIRDVDAQENCSVFLQNKSTNWIQTQPQTSRLFYINLSITLNCHFVVLHYFVWPYFLIHNFSVWDGFIFCPRQTLREIKFCKWAQLDGALVMTEWWLYYCDITKSKS